MTIRAKNSLTIVKVLASVYCVAVHWNPKKKEWIAPYDPNCENCGEPYM